MLGIWLSDSLFSSLEVQFKMHRKIRRTAAGKVGANVGLEFSENFFPLLEKEGWLGH
jgi:hypothetical protein